MGVVNASPYSAGLLAGIFPDEAAKRRKAKPLDVERARDIWLWCRERDLAVGALAVRFCFETSGIATTLVGPRTRQEIDDNIRHATTPVSNTDWAAFTDYLTTLGPPNAGGETK